MDPTYFGYDLRNVLEELSVECLVSECELEERFEKVGRDLEKQTDLMKDLVLLLSSESKT